MLIHIVPKIFISLQISALQAPPSLIDLTVKELGLVLKGGRDITARKPYPNKHYWVGCRKTGQKAVNGLLVESERALSAYTVVTRWATGGVIEDLAGSKKDDTVAILTHHVEHIVVDCVDDVYDSVSDSMLLWHGVHGSWELRRPDCYTNASLVRSEPSMFLGFGEDSKRHAHLTTTSDTFSESGLLMEREERFIMPTIERGRLWDRLAEDYRLPAMEHAFRC